MQFSVERNALRVTPETEQDNAYIEDTLGLRHDGSVILLRRRDAHGLRCIAYLETVQCADPGPFELRELLADIVRDWPDGHSSNALDAARDILAQD